MTEALRIAMTHTRFSYTGGIEKYIYSLVERLLAGGHQVHYFAHRFEDYEHPNLHFHRVPWMRFPKSLRVRSFDRSLNRVLDPSQYDLVHGFTKTSRQDVYTDGSGTLLEYVGANQPDWPRWRRKLHLATPHQRGILAMEQQRFQRHAILKIIPMANFVREQILARYPVDPARVEVIYNGVETEVFHPRNRDSDGPAFRREHDIPEDRPLLLFVGNDWRRKGLSTALQALAQLSEPTLAVAGHDNHPEIYQRQAEELRVADRVHWLGPVREIKNAFAAADVFVFPTRYDVFGNVGLEALASGVPAVLSKEAGVAELLLDPHHHGHARAGERLLDATDANELAEHTARLLEDVESRRAEARLLAEHYSWDRHFEQILAAYRQVIAEKRGRH